MQQVEFLGEDIQGIKPFQPKVEFLGTDYQPQVEFLGEQIPTEAPVTETVSEIPTQEIPTRVEPTPVSARDILNLKGVSTLVPPEKITPPEYTGEPIIRSPQPLEQFLSKPLTPEESKEISFRKEVRLRPTTAETLMEAFTGGIVPYNVDPVTQAKHPVASFAGWVIGLAASGKVAEPIKYIGSLLTRFPALKPAVEQVLHSGATFTVKDLSDQIAEQTGQGKEVSIDTARLLVNTAIGAGFAIPTIPKAVTDSLWYRKLTIKERGMVSLTADELRAKGYSEGDIARVNPQFFKQAFEERLKSEISPDQIAQEFKGSLNTMYQTRRTQYEREGSTPEEASMMAFKDTSKTIEGQNQTRTVLEDTLKKQVEESAKLKQAEEADRLKQIKVIEPSVLSVFPEIGEEVGGGISINTFAPHEIKSLENAGALYTNENGQRVVDINKLWEARKEIQKLPIKEQNKLYEESKAKLFKEQAKEPQVEFLGATEEVLKEQPVIEPEAITEAPTETIEPAKSLSILQGNPIVIYKDNNIVGYKVRTNQGDLSFISKQKAQDFIDQFKYEIQIGEKAPTEAEERKAETTGTLSLTWEDLGISKRDATLYEQKGLTPEEIAGGEEILKKPLEMPKTPVTINLDTILKEGRTSITKDELNRLYDVKSGRVSKQDMTRILQEKGITIEKGKKPKPEEVEKIEVSNQKIESHEKSKGLLEDERGFVNMGAVIDGIKKINPFEANKAELAGLKLKEAKDILTGEKSKIGKLWSIPYHVGRKWKEFKPVFDHVQDSMYEFNELIYNVNEKLPDNIRDKIRGNDKVAEALYSGQEEKTPHWYVRKSAWEKLGLTKEEIKNFDIIKEEIPQTEGAMQTRPETLLEHGYTEPQILDYLKVKKAISDWKQNKEELLDMGLTEGEIFSRKGIGKTLTEDELRAKGLNDEEIGLYNKGRETIDYTSNYLVEKKKHLYGYYDTDTTSIEQAMLDLMINQQVKRYGGYIPLMRFGDNWLSYLNPATGEKTVISFESQLESIKARNELSKEGITVTEIDMKDAKQRRQMYPYMSLSQLDSLIESAGIEGRLSDIKDLRDVIKERMGDVRFIQREWVPGYFRTGENVVKTIEAYADQTLRQYTRGKAKYEAQKVIDNMENLNLKQYSQDYLDTYMSYDKDYFSKARNVAYLFYLGLKPSFAAMNLTQPLMTLLPRLHADTGLFKGSKIFAESQEKFAEYIAYRTAQLAGKSIKTRLDKDLLDALEKARKQEIISAQWIQEVLGTKQGVKTLEGVKAIEQVTSNLLGIVGTSTEKVNRVVSFIAGWDAAKTKGLSNEQAFEMGKDYVASTQFIYGRQNIPVQINKLDQRLKGLGKSSFLFQSWGLNYIHNLNYFLRGALSGTEKVQNLKGLMSTLTILGGMTGIRGIPLILLAGSIYTLVTGNSPDEKFREALGKEHKELADYLLYGPVSKTLGVNVSSLVGLGDYPSLKPAMLGIGERYKRASQFYNQDRYWKMVAEMSPDMIRNYLHGKKMEEEGTARVLSTGEKLTLGGEPIEITSYEAGAKKLGFTPLKVAKAQEERYAENLLSNKLKDLTSEYTTKMADAIVEGNDEKLSKIEREIELKNKGLPFEINIDRKALKDKIALLEQGRTIKKFPKRIRPEIQERRELYK